MKPRAWAKFSRDSLVFLLVAFTSSSGGTYKRAGFTTPHATSRRPAAALWQIGLCCSCRSTTRRTTSKSFGSKSGTCASVQRRRRALDFDIELHEPVEQRGLPKEVASGISAAQGCVVSVLKQTEPEQRSENSCLHRH